MQDQRRRVPRAGQGDGGSAAGRRDELAMDQRHEWRPGSFSGDQRIEPLKHGRDIMALPGQDAQRMPGKASYCGGLGTLAADIADGEPPTAPGDLEHVVEVAANLIPLAR